MNHYHRPPFRHPEQSITSFMLMGSDATPKVRIEHGACDGGHRFSVTGAAQIGRISIASIMSRPLGENPDWAQVEKGLRTAVYPSRTVKKLHGTMPGKARLARLRAASDELAEIVRGTINISPSDDPLAELRRRLLDGSLDQRQYIQLYMEHLTMQEDAEPFSVYTEQPITAPVFDESAAVAYAEQLLAELNPRLVLEHLAKYTDEATTKKLEMLVPRQPSTIPGLSDVDQAAIQAAVMRRVDGKAYIDVVHELMDRVLIGIPDEATYDEQGMTGGGYDAEYYIRRSDIPSQFADNQDVRIVIERELRDHDPQTGLPQHQLKIIVRKNALVAHPRIVWTNQGGTRSLEFPTSLAERTVRHSTVVRPSSLLGAAIAANHIGMDELKVDYGKELRKLVGSRSRHSAPLARAGMLGFVLHTESERLLAHPYFARIERYALEYIP